MKKYEPHRNSRKHTAPQTITVVEEDLSEDEALELNESMVFPALQRPAPPSYHLPPPLYSMASPTPIPKIAHFAWEGGELPQLFLYNVLNFKRLNPEYDVFFWTSRPMSFFKALDRAMESTTPDRGMVSMTPAYRYMAFHQGKKINVENPAEAYAQVSPEIRGFYEREKSGPYSNFAAASDITRLVLMHVMGGLYMDVDVSTVQPIQQIGRGNKLFMYRSGERYGNAVLASAPKTNATQRVLEFLMSTYMNSPALWDSKRSELESRFSLTLSTTGPQAIYYNSEGMREDLTDPVFGQRRGDLQLLQVAMGDWKKVNGARVRYEFSGKQLLDLGHVPGLNADGDWANGFKKGRRSSIS
ncbi:Mannosyltransferase OCH1 and related enzymes [Pseudomonas sp. LAMO17WK12:I10]|uniref:glycosyltransferase family 32 protein n=1 Tax=unclassified Pseudomonas TaxID=196821 RepID=UPI000BD8BF0D|nr:MULTISPECIES: glycosyltransferase [unclassified Pseudomonas]PXX51581.1 glycosyl transferase-like sugar-binding protein [Pseudomonas sp. LAMO17WK12:I9]SNY53685.1 Mannosyltransferase OCH1 and related enzymes [Pseudomonas sp. LAMO17WK12:I10]